MSLSFYIKEHFERNGFVSIPGLGYFELKYRSPVIDRDQIRPPAEKIDFHYNQNLEDDTLAKYITEHSEISIGRSLKKVESFSKNDIGFHLEKFKRFRLDNFGDLVREDNGYIHFEPMAKDSLIYNSFGLEAVALTIPEKEKKKVSALWLWLLLPFLLLFLALSVDYGIKYSQYRIQDSFVLNWLSPNNNQPSISTPIEAEKKEEKQIEAESEKSDPSEPAVLASIDPAKSESIKVVGKNPQQTPQGSRTAVKGDGTKVYVFYPVDAFTIIVSEHQSKREARKNALEMRRQGYAGKVIGRDANGMYLVSILTYSKANAARKRLANIKNYISGNAYIITK